MDIDTLQLPIWVVQGVNFIAKVQTDEYNAQFAPLHQAEEAATRIIEQFKGHDRKIPCEISGEQKIPELGGVLLVYLLNSDPQDGFLLMVHELLANAGFYKDSFAVQKLTEETLKENNQTEDDILKIKKTKKEKKKPVKKPRKRGPNKKKKK
jgi:hypothetical protein